jgi:predicted nucleic acid-binding protein
MNKYLLDTNVIIDFLKGKTDAVQIIKKIQKNPLHVSVITIAEYNYGALRSVKIKETLDLFIDFCDRAQITTVSINKSVAEKFAQIQASLSKKGKLRPVFDLLIASSCLINNCILVTRNKKDFEGIEGLKLFGQ